MSRKLGSKILLMMVVTLTPFISSSCGSACKESVVKRPFKATALLLDESAFPTSWKQTGGGKIPSGPLGGSVAIERFEAFFNSKDALAFHQVYRYSCTRQAIDEYGILKKAEYKDTVGGRDWQATNLMMPWSKHADESYLACGFFDGTEQRCQAIARYEEYVVEFYSRLSSRTFSVSDLESVLKTMDSNIGRTMGK